MKTDEEIKAAFIYHFGVRPETEPKAWDTAFSLFFTGIRTKTDNHPQVVVAFTPIRDRSRRGILGIIHKGMVSYKLKKSPYNCITVMGTVKSYLWNYGKGLQCLK
jgi:hypothetical protein